MYRTQVLPKLFPFKFAYFSTSGEDHFQPYLWSSRPWKMGCDLVCRNNIIHFYRPVLTVSDLVESYPKSDRKPGIQTPTPIKLWWIRLFARSNVLFSDTFVPRLATLGNTATRHELDNSAAANDKGFWVDFHRRCAGIARPYWSIWYRPAWLEEATDSMEVCECWLQAAIARFTISETHESDFYP